LASAERPPGDRHTPSIGGGHSSSRVRRITRWATHYERSCGGTARERKEASGKPAAAPGGRERRQLGATFSARKLPSTVPPGGRCGRSPEPTPCSRTAPPARASGPRAPARTGHATAKHPRQRDRENRSLAWCRKRGRGCSDPKAKGSMRSRPNGASRRHQWRPMAAAPASVSPQNWRASGGMTVLATPKRESWLPSARSVLPRFFEAPQG